MIKLKNKYRQKREITFIYTDENTCV